MPQDDVFAPSWAPRMLSVLRIMTALLFLAHGTQKLFGFPTPQYQPDFLTLSWFAAAIELVGGVLLTLGLFTRAAAFVCAGQMAFAYFIAHFPKSFFPAVNGGDAAVLFCFIFLYLFVAGGGAWSVDAARNRV